MKTIETITAKNITRLDDIAEPLAGAYKVAFAGPPWFEASRCENDDCDTAFSPDMPGEVCNCCGIKLVDAYDVDALIGAWRRMIEREDASMDVTINTDGLPTLATMARPTTPDELFERKYNDVESMDRWLGANMPRELVWIEDTFANRAVSPSGNMADRGKTLGDIAMRYGGLLIATRTLTPAIIKSTLRDLGRSTELLVGENQVGDGFANLARSVGQVPDRRTMLKVDLGS